MTTARTINAEDLRMVIAAAKLRRCTQGATCQLAVVTRAPVVRTDCSNANRARMREHSQRMGQFNSFVAPMERGHMAELVMRTRLAHGLDEVRKTWRTGLRALLDEPRHVLNGGAA